MKICVWNIRRTTFKRTEAWEIINNIQPDILCLQEINSWPKEIEDTYQLLYRKALNKNGHKQKFHTMIMVKGIIKKKIKLTSKINSVNETLKKFEGNLVACEIKLNTGKSLNVMSVYSPAWPLNEWVSEKDRKKIILTNNNKVWLTELLWDSLKQHYNNNSWVIAGDLNASMTFDSSPHMPGGNQEIMDRMEDIGYIECIFNFNKKLIPTFQNPQNKKIIHQMDHLFVSNDLYDKINGCSVLSSLNIFEENISDHLPIVGEFKL